jgi:hypothetical protein
MMGRLTEAQKAKLPASAFCGRGRSFYVTKREDISNAVSSMGRAGSDAERAEIKACLIRKAKMMGAMDALPQNWRDEMKGKG